VNIVETLLKVDYYDTESIIIDLYYRNLLNREFKQFFEINCHFYLGLECDSSGNPIYVINVWKDGHLLFTKSIWREACWLDYATNIYLGILYHNDIYYTVNTLNGDLEFNIL
jgi:hypothetical protein